MTAKLIETSIAAMIAVNKDCELHSVKELSPRDRYNFFEFHYFRRFFVSHFSRMKMPPNGGSNAVFRVKMVQSASINSLQFRTTVSRVDTVEEYGRLSV